jgi:hypothetical protein
VLRVGASGFDEMEPAFGSPGLGGGEFGFSDMDSQRA